MAIDPVTGMIIAQGVGSFFNGLASDAASKRSERLQRQQMMLQHQLGMGQLALGRRGQGQSELGQANEIGRQLDAAPIRDRVQYQIMQRLGQTPQAFNPKNMFDASQGNDFQGSTGGIDFEKLAADNAKYQPGAGGVNTDRLEFMLKRLGYGNDQVGNPNPVTLEDQANLAGHQNTVDTKLAQMKQQLAALEAYRDKHGQNPTVNGMVSKQIMMLKAAIAALGPASAGFGIGGGNGLG